MKFKNWFIVVKNGLVGYVSWYGKDTCCVNFYKKGCLYWSGEVFKSTIINNLKYGHYKIVKGLRF